MQVPQGHHTIMPYLILNNAAKFSQFAVAVFAARVTLNTLREDSKTIRHSELIVGDSTIMFADASEQYTPQNANLFIYVQNADDTFHVALKHGAQVVMELSDQDYGRTCGVKDPFGNTWWITSIAKNTGNDLVKE